MVSQIYFFNNHSTNSKNYFNITLFFLISEKKLRKVCKELDITSKEIFSWLIFQRQYGYPSTQYVNLQKETSINFIKERDLQAVFRIRIHRIHMFLALPDPDPLVRGTRCIQNQIENSK
jgi:hypothetical protein